MGADLYPEEQCAHDIAKHQTAPVTSPKIAWVDGGYVDGKKGDVGPGYRFNATVPVPDSDTIFFPSEARAASAHSRVNCTCSSPQTRGQA